MQFIYNYLVSDPHYSKLKLVHLWSPVFLLEISNYMECKPAFICCKKVQMLKHMRTTFFAQAPVMVSQPVTMFHHTIVTDPDRSQCNGVSVSCNVPSHCCH